MYKKIVPLVLLLALSLSAQEKNETDTWELQQFKIYFENDMFGTFTDSQYSSGEKFSTLFHVKEPTNFMYDFLYAGDKEYDIFTTISIGNQIYTPDDLTATELQENQRPYGGWTYLEMGMHKSTSDTLNSLQLKVGMIGPSSHSEEIQTVIHELVNAGLPMGWDHQLDDELGVNFTYSYKLRYSPKPVMGWVESAFIPYGEVDLGNVSTQASLGMFMRVGYNIPQDFGLSTLDNAGEANIPVYGKSRVNIEKDWSVSFNLALSGSAVARDIFLDGNTFSDSHSIEKNNFVAYLATGISVRYKSLMVDFMNTTNTAKYDGEGAGNNKYQSVGTVIASWMF